MRLSSKCIVVAFSALFAITPMVPAAAMPLGAVKAQPVEGGADVTLIDQRCIYCKRGGGGDWRARVFQEQSNWYGDSKNTGLYSGGPRRYRDGWSERRRYRDGWSGHRGYRDGWYRGHRGYRYARPGYRRHDNGFWFPLAAFGAGAIIGGAIANDRVYSGGGSHVNWCANRYRSYRAYDNTFQPYNGPRRQCLSPYR